MKKNIIVVFIVLFFLSACTHTDVSSSNETQNEQMNQDSSIDESDNQLRKQTFCVPAITTKNLKKIFVVIRSCKLIT